MLKLIWRQAYRLLILLSVVIVLPVMFSGSCSVGELLVYSLNNFSNKTVYVYDTHYQLSAPLVRSINYVHYSINVNGLLAFSSPTEGSGEIYVLDTQIMRGSPLGIGQKLEGDSYQLSWSPDGIYLAFVAISQERNQLYVWDGKSIVNLIPDEIENAISRYSFWWSPTSQYLAFELRREDESALLYLWNGETVVKVTADDMPDKVEYYSVSWSPDERFAFSIGYREEGELQPDSSKYYWWDGQDAISLSKNLPNMRLHAWGADGRALFMSIQDSNYDLYVWDGISLKDGLPDKDTFVHVAPGLIGYYSSPEWTPDGQIVFISQTADDSHAQIYVWDGTTATNISQNPTLHNSRPVWSVDGRWAFVTFFSAQQLLYVRDAENRNLLTTEGQASLAWSSSGLLMYCRREMSRWIVSVWDGQHISKVAEVDIAASINAQWQNGAGVICSAG